MGNASLTTSQAEFVDRQRVARLATVTEEARPHVVPISPALDVDRLVFATDRPTAKVRHIEGDPHVALAFDEYTEDWTALRQVIVFGTAMIVESGPEFERDRGLLYDKYEQYSTVAPIERGTSVLVEIRIDRVFADGV